MDLCTLRFIVHRVVRIFFLKSLLTQRIQKCPRTVIAFRRCILRNLVIAKFECDMAAVCDLLRVVCRFLCIRKQAPHLLFTFYEKLSAFVTHTVFICNLLSGLDTEKDIVCLHIGFIGVVDIIRADKRNVKFLADPKKPLIDRLLIRDAMILQFQKIVVFSETVLVFFCNAFCLFIKTAHNIARHFSRQTCRQADQSLMVFLQRLKIHTRPVIVPFRKPDRDDLHKVCIACIVFRKQNQMVIPVLAMAGLTVKPGIWRHIDLTANHRVNICCLCGLVEFHHTVHIAMVGDRGTVHPQFFHTAYIFFYFVGTIE